MRKSDVQTHSGHPAVNVKHHLWLPDLFDAYEGTGTHEFSDDAGFWAWLHEIDDRSDWDHDGVMRADEWAREHCWELAQEAADEVWPDRRFESRYRKVGGKFVRDERGEFVKDRVAVPSVKIYSEGRQGGWAVADGLPDIETWDAIALGRWAKFQRAVEQIAHEEYPYQFIWQLYVNVWEHVRAECQNQYPAPAYA